MFFTSSGPVNSKNRKDAYRRAPAAMGTVHMCGVSFIFLYMSAWQSDDGLTKIIRGILCFTTPMYDMYVLNMS